MPAPGAAAFSTGTTTSTTTPTAQEVYSASLAAAKGNDVRIVYNDATELNRTVQRFTSAQIDLWFPLQVAIGGAGSDTSSYQVYYGNASAGVPPADTNAVFLPVADANTMGLWHFQEAGGSTVYDASGRGHNGAFSGAGWADGWLGTAGQFNGSSSVVDFGNQSDFNVGAFTLEGWILFTSPLGNYPHVFNKESYWLRIVGDRKPELSAFGGSSGTNCSAINSNTWFHVAATYDGVSDYRVYVNGQQCAQRTESHGPNFTSAPLKLGWTTNWPSAGYFPGLMQHMRISNIVRTDFSYARITVAPIVASGDAILPPSTALPDLALQSLTTYPVDGETFEQGVIVQAVVKNQGNASTVSGFYTDFYADHLPTGPGDYSGSVRFLVNEPIAAGATVTLTTVLTNIPGLAAAQTAGMMSPMQEVTSTIYTQTDSTGVVKESTKGNNISSTGVSVCLATADAYENDDSAPVASLISLDSPQGHNFHAMGDEDWLKFDALASTTYSIRTSELASNADTYVYLYDTDGTTLLASNDDAGDSLASSLEWTAPSTGTYYVRVRNWNPNVGGCGAAYTVSITRRRPCFVLTRAHTGSGSNPVASPANSDSCPAGQYLAGAPINLTASPASGWRVASWSGTDNNSSIATTNSLMMPASNHTVTVNYAIANVIQPSTRISDTIGSPGEQDTYRYASDSVQWISVRMFGDGNFDPYLTLENSAGAVLTSDDNGAHSGTAAFFTYLLPNADAYQIIASGTGTTTGGYRLGLARGRSAGIADVNHDCVVDGADIAAILNCWGPVQGACSDADADLDGQVGIADQLLVLNQFYRTCPASPNLLANGGFEDGTGLPTAWTTAAWNPSRTQFAWDLTQARSGSRSVKISSAEPNDARWTQTVNVIPNADYRLSGCIKTEGVAHTAESNDVGANLSIMELWGPHSPGLLGTHDWTCVEYYFNSGDASQLTVAARLGYYSGTTAGVAWFDDLRLELAGTPWAQLWSEINFGGTKVWNGGPGLWNDPNANSYSLRLPSGWSAKTWRGDNRMGEMRCWSASVNNLQDYGWHLAIQSMEVFDYNSCPVTPTPTSTPTGSVTPTRTPTPMSTPNPGSALSCPTAPAGLALDGYLTEWAGWPALHLDKDSANYSLRTSRPSVTDLSGDIYCAWQGNDLIIAGRMSDDVLKRDSATIWNDDGFEFGIDGLGDGFTYGSQDDHQFTVVTDGAIQDLGAYAVPGATVFARPVSGGWAVELRLPASVLGMGTLFEGRAIRFNVGLNDDDDGGSRDDWLVWRGERTIDQSENFGALILSGSQITTSTPTPTRTIHPSITPSPTITPTATPTPTRTPSPPGTLSTYLPLVLR